MTRAEHLTQCKQRGLSILAQGDIASAITSMLLDLNQFDMGYDIELLKFKGFDGIMFCSDDAKKAWDWIESWK